VTGAKILDMLITLIKKRRTLIVVTHDADIAKKADQIITLKDGKTIPAISSTRRPIPNDMFKAFLALTFKGIRYRPLRSWLTVIASSSASCWWSSSCRSLAA